METRADRLHSYLSAVLHHWKVVLVSWVTAASFWWGGSVFSIARSGGQRKWAVVALIVGVFVAQYLAWHDQRERTLEAETQRDDALAAEKERARVVFDVRARLIQQLSVDLFHVVLEVENQGALDGRFIAIVQEVGGMPSWWPFVPYGDFNMQWEGTTEDVVTVPGDGNRKVLVVGEWMRPGYAFRFTIPSHPNATQGRNAAGPPFAPSGPLDIELQVREVDRAVSRNFRVHLDFDPTTNMVRDPVVMAR